MPKLEGLASAENKRLALVTLLLRSVFFATATRRLPTLIVFGPKRGSRTRIGKTAPVKPLLPFFKAVVLVTVAR